MFVRDRQAGTTERVSVGLGRGAGQRQAAAATRAWRSRRTARSVAFPSDASNLVQGDTNGKIDIFVHAH